MLFSIYSIILFARLCRPKENENTTAVNRWQWNQTIECFEDEKKYEEDLATVEIAWTLLVLITCYFFIRDIINCVSLRLKFFMRLDTYRRLLTDALLIFCLYKGFISTSSIFENFSLKIDIDPEMKVFGGTKNRQF